MTLRARPVIFPALIGCVVWLASACGAAREDAPKPLVERCAGDYPCAVEDDGTVTTTIGLSLRREGARCLGRCTGSAADVEFTPSGAVVDLRGDAIGTWAGDSRAFVARGIGGGDLACDIDGVRGPRR